MCKDCTKSSLIAGLCIYLSQKQNHGENKYVSPPFLFYKTQLLVSLFLHYINQFCSFKEDLLHTIHLFFPNEA